MMRLSRIFTLGLALCTVLSTGTSARAMFVDYITQGVFTSSGTAQFNNGNVVITYNEFAGSVDASPTSQASFGTFDTTGTTATGSTVTDTFTLTIIELDPVAGSLDYVGHLTGKLTLNGSSAHIQFDAPLSQTVPGTFPTTFAIVSADGGIAGRKNLNPPTTNNGISALDGQITVVPEPSTLSLTALAGSTLLALGYRRRGRGRARAAA